MNKSERLRKRSPANGKSFIYMEDDPEISANDGKMKMTDPPAYGATQGDLRKQYEGDGSAALP